MKKKNKSKSWFIKVRGSYLPNNKFGWLTYIPYIAYLVYSVWVGFSYTTSKQIAILYIFPNFVGAAVVMTYLASKKS